MRLDVWCCFFFFQAEDGIRDRSPSRGLGDVYKRQGYEVRAMEKKGIKTVIGELNRAIRQFNQMFISLKESIQWMKTAYEEMKAELDRRQNPTLLELSLIHISEPTRRTPISYAVFCLKKKKNTQKQKKQKKKTK